MITTIPKDSIRKASIYVNAGKKSMAQIKKALGCQYILNAGLFNMSTFKPINMLTVDQKVLSTGGNPYGYAISGDKLVFSYGNNVKYPTFLGAYPVLVRDSKVTGAAEPAGLEGFRPRSCVGLRADGGMVLLCCQSDRSLNGVADELKQAGCVTAINLDGGGSTQGDFDGRAMTAGRIVHNYLCIWTKESGTGNGEKEEPAVDKHYKVCIDPGHSAGEAQGSPDGTYKEHEFALDVGIRIKEILERCGVGVVMTRTDGSAVTLNQRAVISDRAGCDLFLSIHTNAAGGGWSVAGGWGAYVVSKGAKAETLAEAIRTESLKLLGCADRGVNTANYTVLVNTSAPAVLVEHGFHTNRAEVEKLKEDDYRQFCAEADARGILKVLGIDWVDETPTERTEAELARKWAMEQGISDGTKPDKALTREQAWVMLYRARKGAEQ